MDFDKKTQELFFGADLTKSNKRVFDFYKSLKQLSFEPAEGWTIYPPLSALGKKGHSEFHKFRFTSHPHLHFKFRDGEIVFRVQKSDHKEQYNKPFLKIIFDTKGQSELAYSQLTQDFTKISSQKRFDNQENTKSAEFSSDNSKLTKGIAIHQGKGDVLANGYVVIVWLDNDFENENQ